MKRTYIVGDTPILHNGDRLPPGASIELTFDELRSLGLPLEELLATASAGLDPTHVIRSAPFVEPAQPSALLPEPEAAPPAEPPPEAEPPSESAAEPPSELPPEDSVTPKPRKKGA